ncbi:hypothetical protein M404DRAFT_1003497, partial [Pisolithus tinctorius Marx 270]
MVISDHANDMEPIRGFSDRDEYRLGLPREERFHAQQNWSRGRVGVNTAERYL